MRRPRIRKVTKAALSLGLLAGIVLYIGPRGVFEQLAWMSSTLVALAFALLLAESLVRTLNWFQLMRGAGCDVPLATSAYAYFTGGFLGALLPSSVGTDVARSAVAATRTKTRLEVLLATTVLLNLLSLVVIGAVGVAACAWLLSQGRSPLTIMAASLGASAVCALGVVALFACASAVRRPDASEAPAPSAGLLAAARRRIGRFAAALLVLPPSSALAGVSTVAVCSYALRSLGWLTLLAAADVQVSWVVLLSLGPLVTLGAALPISVLGFGGFQAVSVYALTQWGIPPEQALAASLVQSGLVVLMYGVGCAVYLAGGSASFSVRASESVWQPGDAIPMNERCP